MGEKRYNGRLAENERLVEHFIVFATSSKLIKSRIFGHEGINILTFFTRYNGRHYVTLQNL